MNPTTCTQGNNGRGGVPVVEQRQVLDCRPVMDQEPVF